MNKLPLCTLALLLAACSKPAAPEEKPAADVKADAKAPEAPPVAAMPAAPQGPATLDDLLGLVHEGSPNYLVFKTPDNLLAVAELAAKTFETPLTSLALAAAPTQAQEISQGFTLFKTGMADVRAAIATAGADLGRGVVISETEANKDEPILTFSAASPEAGKGLLAALKLPEADKFTCQAAPGRAGYVACSESQQALAAYKPTDAKAARARTEAALPGLALDNLGVLGFFDGVHMALGEPSAGGAVFHMSAPADAADMLAALAPGKADLLRFVPPGTGFVWMRLDRDELKRNGLGAVPPPFDASVAAFTGEVLLGGSADPAALQARLGFSDTSALSTLTTFASAAVCPSMPKKIPDVPGSKLGCDTPSITFGSETAKALHVSVSGVPQAKALADQLGLSLDAWIFAAEGTLAAVVGADDKGVARVRAPAAAETLTALPPALAESLRVDEVGFVTHIPLDGLQSPALVKLLDDSLGALPGYQPALVRLALGVASPLSSATMWVTETGGTGALHFAIQTIGHTGDEEGQAALAAASAADPAAAFAALVTTYPSSPRLAAYQARAGQGGVGAIVGSSAPTLLMLGAAGLALFGADATSELIEAPPMPPALEPAPVEPAPVEPEKTEPAEPTKPAKKKQTKTEEPTEPTKPAEPAEEPAKAEVKLKPGRLQPTGGTDTTKSGSLNLPGQPLNR